MSLSPLYAILIMDLHVTTTSALHRAFARLQPDHVKITIFRVTFHALLLKFSASRKLVEAAPFDRLTPNLLSLRPWVCEAQRLEREIHSLVRVSRRVNRRDFVSSAMAGSGDEEYGRHTIRKLSVLHRVRPQPHARTPLSAYHAFPPWRPREPDSAA